MNREQSHASREQVAARVANTVGRTPVFDIHTHLYDPAFGSLLLYGIDELLTYHYLVAETFRYTDLSYDAFWSLSKEQQADHIWDQLFIQHSPISEACRGVLTTLNRLGLDANQRDLPAIRRWYAEQQPGEFVDRCLEIAQVRQVCMTNSPFDPEERPTWESAFNRHERFVGGLRIDPLLLDWENTVADLNDQGFATGAELTDTNVAVIRQFLEHWTRRIEARYLMVSLPPTFDYPRDDTVTRLLDAAILPHCREHGLPLALMIGVKRAVNPRLQLAGDGMGRSDLAALERLCQQHPENKFLCTVLARENQHELCVLARKFPNLHIFGCWWFTNVPSIIDEMTRQRLELVGLSVTPQHSDARVLDQLIYKWDHSREVITRVLTEKYYDLERTGWRVTDAEMERDIQDLFGGAFEQFCRP